MHKLAKPGDPRGVSVDTDGVFYGGVRLVDRDARGWFAVIDLQRLAGSAPIDFIGRMSGLQAVAAALNEGNQCLAHILAVHLRLPELDAELVQRITKFDAAELRLPRGVPDGGEWTEDDDAAISPVGYKPSAKTRVDFETDLRYAPKALRDSIAAYEQAKDHQRSDADYGVVNPRTGAMGLYQFLDSTLIGNGLKTQLGPNGWGDTAFATAFGIKTDREFLGNHDAQDAAMAQMIKGLLPEMLPVYAKYGERTYIGIEGHPITVTKAGIVAAMHREGGKNVRAYFAKFHAKSTVQLRNTGFIPNDPKESAMFAAIEQRLREAQGLLYNQ